jgi:hypothetical protein
MPGGRWPLQGVHDGVQVRQEFKPQKMPLFPLSCMIFQNIGIGHFSIYLVLEEDTSIITLNQAC